MKQKHCASGPHASTLALKKLVTNKKILYARDKKRDNEKPFDAETKKIKKCIQNNDSDTDQQQTSDEYFQDSVEDD